MDWRHRVAAAVLCMQLLLVFHTYRSTDFEVHRNWLAITHSLPISQWYLEATSEWTLDYPPLFAWFEWAMAKAAQLFDPRMLDVRNLEYASDATVLFQRLSVCASSLVLVAAMLKVTGSGSRGSPAQRLTAFVLVVANAGLIMVDNIHFQYNSILMGVLVYSILFVEEGRYVLGGVLFAVLLNMKHLFAYLGPVYFVFLLKHYVLADSSSDGWRAAAGRLVLLGGAVVAVCAASFGPFVAMGQMKQVLSRLFPFARGLCHAYWAPNAWALYSALDKVGAAAGARAGLLAGAASANMAGGIVGVSSYVVLPNVGGGTCAALVLLAMLPCLVALWRAPRQQAGAMLGPAIAYANLCGFMFGYHVHEKAALTVEVPLALAAVGSSDWGQLYVLFSTAAHVGIFPLLFTTQEVPIRWLLAVVYYVCCVWGLGSIHATQQQQQQQQQLTTTAAAGAGSSPQKHLGSMRTRRQLAQASTAPAVAKQQRPQAATGSHGMHEYCSWLPLAYRAYLAGFVLLELYCSLGHTALLGSRLPFVPLMLTSVYCALGFCWTWGWMAAWFVQRC